MRMLRALRNASAAFTLLASASLAGGYSALAAEFRWASSGDVQSLDPHFTIETFSTSMLANVYEPLVRRLPDMKLEPALATSWEQTNPLTWTFRLRQDVTFQDGTPFTAADVLFSFERASSPGSAIKGYFAAVDRIEATDPYTVVFKMKRVDPILPEEISAWLIMSKAWSEQHGAAKASGAATAAESFATLNAMGTGPFHVVTREPGVKTVFEANPKWWDKPQHNVTKATYLAIPNQATAVAALLAGSIDMIYDVPSDAVDNLSRSSGIKILTRPELRVIYVGFDVTREELLDSSVKGKNPFKDPRVRRAFAEAIDVQAIKRSVMRGLSQPTFMMVADGIKGYNKDLNIRPTYSPASAKKLLAEAGYPDGFTLGMDCPNDRYPKDEDTCQAIVGMLAKIGIKVNLLAQTKTRMFPKVFSPRFETSFFLLGWAPSSNDAHSAYERLLYSRGRSTEKGTYNITGFHNDQFDGLIDAAGVEIDPVKRQAMLDEAARIVQREMPTVPLHQPLLVWAARDGVTVEQYPDDFFPLRLVRVGKTGG
ncbi:ABC transporter substrate-binding protein [Xanthobacter dioxanivorans]|uniref:ABC transporter substrate-binding protein n=1 Tax=Xanthobacter dioxanivorans TaxID=2528964 RepID=A0A974PTH6_9HYPH|nr:ABC transporter substrate-binding protein [Xanthobacter dioxanivorans]QRG09256.1 ABC transporter substrate-binding protein [Xanthobacter dioxanivorans]